MCFNCENRLDGDTSIMGEVTKIPEPTQQKLKKAKARIRRVGIYARVSTNRQAQLHSMAAQVSELTRFVSNRPEWKLTDIYLGKH